ncbi:MAG: alanine dehydrogenase [Armatimonadota bacterium]
MFIGIPKEIKDSENRVAITPAGVATLVHAGHRVAVETQAGVGSGFADEDFVREGAEIVSTAGEAWGAEMVLKVKEPLPPEYPYLRDGLILFTYLHLASAPELTNELLERRVTAIGYETVQFDNGELPLLAPMSEVAGRMAVQVGAQFLERPYGGKGILLGGVPGVEAATVVIVGGGIVGTNAAKIALGMGAHVILLDINADRLRYLDENFHGRTQTLMSNRYNITRAVSKADLLIGAVLIPGARAPHLVTEEMVKTMEPGSVIVDVAIDQGGSIETVDHATTHHEPIYLRHGIIHYAVPNIPGAVARTSTLGLTNVTMPYALRIANKGCCCVLFAEDRALARGVNTMDGNITSRPVAESLGYPYADVLSVCKA